MALGIVDEAFKSKGNKILNVNFRNTLKGRIKILAFTLSTRGKCTIIWDSLWPLNNSQRGSAEYLLCLRIVIM